MPLICSHALQAFEASLAELEDCCLFVEKASAFRPRVGKMLDWNSMDGESKSFAQEYLNMRDVPTHVIYRSLMIVLSGAFEELIRSIIKDCVIAINNSAESFDVLDKNIANRNIERTGNALSTIFNPPDHDNVDYNDLCRRIGTCVRGSKKFELNEVAFSLFLSNATPDNLEKFLGYIHIPMDWDIFGRDQDLQRIFGKSSIRETRKAVEENLKQFIRDRNKIAHTGTTGVEVTENDLKKSIQFFRAFSKVLAQHVQNSLPV